MGLHFYPHIYLPRSSQNIYMAHLFAGKDLKQDSMVFLLEIQTDNNRYNQNYHYKSYGYY